MSIFEQKFKNKNLRKFDKVMWAGQKKMKKIKQTNRFRSLDLEDRKSKNIEVNNSI